MTDKLDKRKLRELLKATHSLPSMAEPQNFWSDFRSRAALTRQLREVPEQRVAADRHWQWRLSTVAAVLVALLAAYSLISQWFPGSDPGDGKVAGQPRPIPSFVASDPADRRVPELSVVEEVEVAVDCDGILIFQDHEHGATFLLLARLDHS